MILPLLPLLPVKFLSKGRILTHHCRSEWRARHAPHESARKNGPLSPARQNDTRYRPFVVSPLSGEIGAPGEASEVGFGFNCEREGRKVIEKHGGWPLK